MPSGEPTRVPAAAGGFSGTGATATPGTAAELTMTPVPGTADAASPVLPSAGAEAPAEAPPWRCGKGGLPAMPPAPPPVTVNDDEPELADLRKCRVCNKTAYAGRGICMNKGCDFRVHLRFLSDFFL